MYNNMYIYIYIICIFNIIYIYNIYNIYIIYMACPDMPKVCENDMRNI